MKHPALFTAVLFTIAPTLAGSAFAAPAAVQTVATVHIKNFAYVKPSLKIHAGDSVLFINDDGDAHTVTSDDKAFASGGMDTGDRWTHTFSKAGTFHYFCALHPYMKGTIIVAPAGKH